MISASINRRLVDVMHRRVSRPIFFAAFKRAYVGQFETLRLAHEVRDEADYFSDIPEVKPEMVKLA
jgi:hypothetical protein